MSANCIWPAKCCRICSAECENIEKLFETAENGKRAVDMLEFCLQHPIDTSDCFPTWICIECITGLIQTYQFFVLYKKSEEHFVSLYQKHNEMNIDACRHYTNVKIESIELPEINEVLIKTELLGMDFTTATDLIEGEVIFDYLDIGYQCVMCNIILIRARRHKPHQQQQNQRSAHIIARRIPQRKQ